MAKYPHSTKCAKDILRTHLGQLLDIYAMWIYKIRGKVKEIEIRRYKLHISEMY